ncbi:MAG: response regulator [Acidobacteriia bacterium]|nr:response regulator [Terriglobia bacterium]
MDRRRLLVIDDEPQIRTFVSEAFAGQYEVVTVGTGEEAIRRAILERPNCILMDVMMPQMGGFMLCEIFKSIRQTKLIPIVLMSGKPRHMVWPTAQEMGVLDYIEKPFSIERMSDSLKRALEESPVERRRAPRVTMKIPLIVRGRDESGNDFEVGGETGDVSRLGAMVRLPVRVPVGGLIEIRQSEAPSPNRPALLTAARVAWNGQVSPDGPFLHGCEFSHPSSEWVIIQ